MLLLLLRHGIAAELSDEISDDFHRPLTSEGRDRTQRAAQGLATLVPRLDALFSSPKVRALQTAQLVRDVYGKNSPAIVEWPELMASSPDEWPAKLQAINSEVVLLAGHEPTLSQFAALALTGTTAGLTLDFKKAGALALDYDAVRGKGTLLWFLTPKALRRLGK